MLFRNLYRLQTGTMIGPTYPAPSAWAKIYRPGPFTYFRFAVLKLARPVQNSLIFYDPACLSAAILQRKQRVETPARGSVDRFSLSTFGPARFIFVFCLHSAVPFMLGLARTAVRPAVHSCSALLPTLA